MEFFYTLFALITTIKHATRAGCDNELQDGSVWYQTGFSVQTLLGRGSLILPCGCRYMGHLATSIRGSTYRDKEFCSLTLSGRCTSSCSTFRNTFSKNRLLRRDSSAVVKQSLTLNACLRRRPTAFIAKGLFCGSSFHSWCANPVLALPSETFH